MQSLRWGSSRCNEETATNLVHALSNMTNLRVLELPNTALSWEAIPEFVQALAQHLPALEEFKFGKFSSVHVDIASRSFGASFGHWRHMRLLHLDVHFRGEALDEFTAALEHMHQLSDLEFTADLPTAEAAPLLARLRSCHALQHLSLRFRVAGPATRVVLTPAVVTQALAACPSLTRLRLIPDFAAPVFTFESLWPLVLSASLERISVAGHAGLLAQVLHHHDEVSLLCHIRVELCAHATAVWTETGAPGCCLRW